MRHRLPDTFDDSCLYLPTNAHMDRFWKDVEHPNPYHFIYMLEDLTFSADSSGKCPTESQGGKYTSKGGTEIEVCGNGGFLDRVGECLPVEQVAHSESLKLKLFSLE